MTLPAALSQEGKRRVNSSSRPRQGVAGLGTLEEWSTKASTNTCSNLDATCRLTLAST